MSGQNSTGKPENFYNPTAKNNSHQQGTLNSLAVLPRPPHGKIWAIYYLHLLLVVITLVVKAPGRWGLVTVCHLCKCTNLRPHIHTHTHSVTQLNPVTTFSVLFREMTTDSPPTRTNTHSHNGHRYMWKKKFFILKTQQMKCLRHEIYVDFNRITRLSDSRIVCVFFPLCG